MTTVPPAAAVRVRFFDGQTAQAHPATLSPEPGGVRVDLPDGRHFHYRADQLQVIHGVGRVQPVIECPAEQRIELPGEPVPVWVYDQRKPWQRHLSGWERSPLWIMAALLLLAALALGTLRWGLPWMAEQVARQLPADTLQQLGDQAEAQVVDLTADSQLSPARQAHIRALYARALAPAQDSRLLFRHGQSIGANALALPNGRIILTDELVALARTDDQLLGVLAHERGHVQHRHSLQQAISGAALSVLVLWITGDSSSLLAVLPAALVSSSYSRDMERDADAYALQQLHQQGRNVLALAEMLEALEAAEQARADGTAGSGGVLRRTGARIAGLLQSHPVTTERIAAIQAYARQHPSRATSSPASMPSNQP